MKTTQGREVHSSLREQGITIVNKEALQNWLLSGSRFPSLALLAAQLRQHKQRQPVGVTITFTPNVSHSQPEVA